MKFSCRSHDLAQALASVASALQTSNGNTMSHNVLLRAEDEKVVLTGTSQHIQITMAVKAEVTEAGGVTLPGKRMLSILKELPSEQVEFSVSSAYKAAIRSGLSKFTIMGADAREYPLKTLADASGSVDIEADILRRLLQQTRYAMSTDETRQIMTSINLTFSPGKVIAVATDGRRLSMANAEIPGCEAQFGMCLPARTVGELCRLIAAPGQINIQASPRTIVFNIPSAVIGKNYSDRAVLVTQVIDGAYPDYRRILPDRARNPVDVPLDVLASCIKRASLVTSEKANNVGISLSPGKIEFNAASPDFGEAHEAVDLPGYNGPAIVARFNPSFLLDILACIQSPKVTLDVYDPNDKAVLSTPGVMAIVMPVRTS